MSSSKPIDGQVQRASIDNFISSLDDWGLLYARTRLQKIVLQFAGLLDLAPETLCHIGSLLTYRDVSNCRLVSREWHRAWNHPAVLLAICKAYFPGLRETHPARKLDDLLSRAVANHLKWRHHGHKRSIIPWKRSWSTNIFINETSPTDPSLSRDCDCEMTNFKVQYSDGIVAWQMDHNLAIVDDLRTRTRQRCALGMGAWAGRRLEVEALSRDLVVFAGKRGSERFGNTVYVIVSPPMR